MRLYNTANSIRSEMETLYKNITGKPSFSAGEADIVNGAIVDAYQRVITEYGVTDFRFHKQDVTKTTTSGTNFVDLEEYIYRIVPGSVCIPAGLINLILIDEVAIFNIDPNDEQTGPPTAYAYKNSTDPNIIRMRLWPTPDAAYIINLQVLQFPTDVITNFPTDLMAAIKNKAKALSCLGFGLGQYKLGFDSEYEQSIAQIKDGYEDAGPKHVQKSYYRRPSQSLESRISD